MAVREKAGLFDVSHMGEFLLSGPDACSSLNHLLCNDYATLQDGAVRYSPMCNETEGSSTTFWFTRSAKTAFFIVVNAANRQKKDFEWMHGNLLGRATLEDLSDQIAQCALQGPRAETILSALISEALPKRYYIFYESPCGRYSLPCFAYRIYREDGFELYCAPEAAPALWDSLLEAGEAYGLIPVGSVHATRCRLEAAMPLRS